MRRFIVKSITIIVGLYVIFAVIDYFYSNMAAHSNVEYIEVWSDIFNGNIDADVLVIGSSRVWVHVDPHIMDSILCADTYDLAFDGSQINRQALNYDIYRKHNKPPKLIVQNIDFSSLDYSRGWKIEQYYPFFWYKDIRRTILPVEPFSFCDKYIPLYRYHGINPLTYSHRIPKYKYKGYRGMVVPWNGDAYMEQDSIDFVVNDTTMYLFEHFLAGTQEEGIPVVFVYAPLYSGATAKIRNIEEMRMTYKSLADKYNIPILDYNDMWISSDTTYFYNAMHLNKQGAEIYSDSLANGIKRLGIL